MRLRKLVIICDSRSVNILYIQFITQYPLCKLFISFRIQFNATAFFAVINRCFALWTELLVMPKIMSMTNRVIARVEA